MFMSVVTRDLSAEVFPELAGARVVITGLNAALGVDLARAFAARKAHLFVQASEPSPEVVEIGTLLAEEAAELKLFTGSIGEFGGSVKFAQQAATHLGGIDALINLIHVSPQECASAATVEEFESLAVAKLEGPLALSQTVANRMRVTWAEGLILNIVSMAAPQNTQEAAVAGCLRQALAAITLGEARRWSGEAIRVNAIGPKSTTLDMNSGACLTSEPDIAALALHLASKKGRSLTGHVFDAEGTARRRCR
jgi:NAD(P)-dependent dehydrogenase (short-subunit alcohol dehydrogenase family)